MDQCTAATAQLQYSKRSLEAEAEMVEVDYLNLRVLEKKYGDTNFAEGMRKLVEERSKVRRKLDQVNEQLLRLEDIRSQSLAYRECLIAAPASPPPPPPQAYSSVPRVSAPVSLVPGPSDAYRIPTIADSVILSNSSTYRAALGK
eukprot:TRINITY_DN27961_c0_g1_i1.p1 TRINITY_DN27961_c0_g1~~TRINITY_DN27961_c0_g1_i1.p1  ORF type:complete len:155 (+),score=30.05 TRINITY_DN27961_c0_g1_i1:32-466(+)